VTDRNKGEKIGQNRVVLLTGEGRGKTTSALGMALRAAGHGLRVCVLQFIKAPGVTGEVAALGRVPEVEIIACGLGFVPRPTSAEYARHQAAAEGGLRLAREKMADASLHMVVLDEICVAIDCGLLREGDVVECVRRAHPGLTVVLTGRGAPPSLVALADTVSRIECVRHGQEAGWPAQRGVEF
jgi:cob(I)alamin adenosyltransferase